jgi:cyclase
MSETLFNPFRVIPVLLVERGRLVKTVRFKKPSYVGDLVNSVRIFNEKEVDELAILDIGASRFGDGPNFDLIRQVTDECFMPLAYGGGVSRVDQIRHLIGIGVEKVIVNSSAMDRLGFVTEAASAVGSQSIVVSVDVKKAFLRGYHARAVSGTRRVKCQSLTQLVRDVVQAGAGEILLNNVDRDGTLDGYDHDLIRLITQEVGVPVVSCGGASGVQDLARAVRHSGAAACAAGALFTFRGPHRAVLLSYPKPAELHAQLRTKE